MLQTATLHNDKGIALDVIAVISSRRMKLFHGSCSLESWQLDLALKVCIWPQSSALPDAVPLTQRSATDWPHSLQGEDPDLAKFTSHMRKAKHCHRMVVDCTASDSPVKLYALWLAAGKNSAV